MQNTLPKDNLQSEHPDFNSHLPDISVSSEGPSELSSPKGDLHMDSASIISTDSVNNRESPNFKVSSDLSNIIFMKMQEISRQNLEAGFLDQGLQAYERCAEQLLTILKGDHNSKTYQDFVCATLHHLNDIALRFLRAGNIDNSLKILNKCLDLAHPEPYRAHPDLQSLTYNHLGCCYRRLGDLDQALYNLQKALHYHKKAMETGIVSREGLESSSITHVNLCAVLSQKGSHKKALEHAKKAVVDCTRDFVKHANRRADPEVAKKKATMLAVSYYNLGVEEDFCKNPDAAMEAYSKAYNLSEENNGPNDPVTLRFQQAIQEAKEKRRSPSNKKSHSRPQSGVSTKNGLPLSHYLSTPKIQRNDIHRAQSANQLKRSLDLNPRPKVEALSAITGKIPNKTTSLASPLSSALGYNLGDSEGNTLIGHLGRYHSQAVLGNPKSPSMTLHSLFANRPGTASIKTQPNLTKKPQKNTSLSMKFFFPMGNKAPLAEKEETLKKPTAPSKPKRPVTANADIRCFQEHRLKQALGYRDENEKKNNTHQYSKSDGLWMTSPTKGTTSTREKSPLEIRDKYPPFKAYMRPKKGASLVNSKGKHYSSSGNINESTKWASSIGDRDVGKTEKSVEENARMKKIIGAVITMQKFLKGWILRRRVKEIRGIGPREPMYWGGLNLRVRRDMEERGEIGDYQVVMVYKRADEVIYVEVKDLKTKALYKGRIGYPVTRGQVKGACYKLLDNLAVENGRIVFRRNAEKVEVKEEEIEEDEDVLKDLKELKEAVMEEISEKSEESDVGPLIEALEKETEEPFDIEEAEHHDHIGHISHMSHANQISHISHVDIPQSQNGMPSQSQVDDEKLATKTTNSPVVSHRQEVKLERLLTSETLYHDSNSPALIKPEPVVLSPKNNISAIKSPHSNQGTIHSSIIVYSTEGNPLYTNKNTSQGEKETPNSKITQSSESNSNQNKNEKPEPPPDDGIQLREPNVKRERISPHGSKRSFTETDDRTKVGTFILLNKRAVVKTKIVGLILESHYVLKKRPKLSLIVTYYNTTNAAVGKADSLPTVTLELPYILADKKEWTVSDVLELIQIEFEPFKVTNAGTAGNSTSGSGVNSKQVEGKPGLPRQDSFSSHNEASIALDISVGLLGVEKDHPSIMRSESLRKQVSFDDRLQPQRVPKGYSSTILDNNRDSAQKLLLGHGLASSKVRIAPADDKCLVFGIKVPELAGREVIHPVEVPRRGVGGSKNSLLQGEFTQRSEAEGSMMLRIAEGVTLHCKVLYKKGETEVVVKYSINGEDTDRFKEIKVTLEELGFEAKKDIETDLLFEKVRTLVGKRMKMRNGEVVYEKERSKPQSQTSITNLNPSQDIRSEDGKPPSGRRFKKEDKLQGKEVKLKVPQIIVQTQEDETPRLNTLTSSGVYTFNENLDEHTSKANTKKPNQNNPQVVSFGIPEETDQGWVGNNTPLPKKRNSDFSEEVNVTFAETFGVLQSSASINNEHSPKGKLITAGNSRSDSGKDLLDPTFEGARAALKKNAAQSPKEMKGGSLRPPDLKKEDISPRMRDDRGHDSLTGVKEVSVEHSTDSQSVWASLAEAHMEGAEGKGDNTGKIKSPRSNLRVYEGDLPKIVIHSEKGQGKEYDYQNFVAKAKSLGILDPEKKASSGKKLGLARGFSVALGENYDYDNQGKLLGIMDWNANKKRGSKTEKSREKERMNNTVGGIGEGKKGGSGFSGKKEKR